MENLKITEIRKQTTQAHKNTLIFKILLHLQKKYYISIYRKKTKKALKYSTEQKHKVPRLLKMNMAVCMGLVEIQSTAYTLKFMK